MKSPWDAGIQVSDSMDRHGPLGLAMTDLFYHE